MLTCCVGLLRHFDVSKHKISCQIIQRNKMNQIKVEEENLKVLKVEFEDTVKIEPEDSGEDQIILKLQYEISALKEKYTRYVLQKEAELCQKNLEIQQLQDELKETRRTLKKLRPDLRTKINGLKNRRLKDYTFPFRKK